MKKAPTTTNGKDLKVRTGLLVTILVATIVSGSLLYYKKTHGDARFHITPTPALETVAPQPKPSKVE